VNPLASSDNAGRHRFSDAVLGCECADLLACGHSRSDIDHGVVIELQRAAFSALVAIPSDCVIDIVLMRALVQMIHVHTGRVVASMTGVVAVPDWATEGLREGVSMCAYDPLLGGVEDSVARRRTSCCPLDAWAKFWPSDWRLGDGLV
jgi:hypothetical protein